MAPDGTVVASLRHAGLGRTRTPSGGGISDPAHDGRRLLWIGQPRSANAKINATLSQVNDIIHGGGTGRPWSPTDLASVVARAGRSRST